jgi:hypothetical protein
MEILNQYDCVFHKAKKNFWEVIGEYGFFYGSKTNMRNILNIQSFVRKNGKEALLNTQKRSLRRYLYDTDDKDNQWNIPNGMRFMCDPTFLDYKLTERCCSFIKNSVKHSYKYSAVGTTIFESNVRRNI